MVTKEIIEAIGSYRERCGYDGQIDYSERLGVWIVKTGDDNAYSAPRNDMLVIDAYIAGYLEGKHA